MGHDRLRHNGRPVHRRSHGHSGTRRRRRFGGNFRLLALQNRLQRIAWLGDMRQIEPGLGFDSRGPRCRSASSTVEVPAHLLGFIFFDGARVRLLLGDANRRQSIQNGSALDF
jgi:hypothetical protein